MVLIHFKEIQLKSTLNMVFIHFKEIPVFAEATQWSPSPFYVPVKQYDTTASQAITVSSIDAANK